MKNLLAAFGAGAWIALLLMVRVYATYIPVNSGTIAYYNAASCPSGWTEMTTLRGLYTVGRVAAGTLATAVGTALTNQENRTHTHTIAHTHTTAQGDFNISGSASSRIGVNGSAFRFNSVGLGVWRAYASTGTATGVSYFGAAGATSGAESVATTSTQTTDVPYMQLLMCSKT